MKWLWVLALALLVLASLVDDVSGGKRKIRGRGIQNKKGHGIQNKKGHGIQNKKGHGIQNKKGHGRPGGRGRRPGPKGRADQCQSRNGLRMNGEQWLSKNCKRLHTCKTGRVKSVAYKCPRFSNCKRKGVCVCAPHYHPRMKKGFLKTCANVKRTCSDSKDRRYQNGERWLSRDCRTRFVCRNGRSIPSRYSCAARAECKHGQCVCKQGWRADIKDRSGFIKRCVERMGCRSEGKIYKNNAAWLNNDCTKLLICKKKQIKSKKFSCPINAHCKLGGQCACDIGYEVINKNRRKPFVFYCKETKKKSCGKGFMRLAGECITLRNGKYTFYDGRDHCTRLGNTLMVPKDIHVLVRKLQKRKYSRGRSYFILGMPQIIARNMNKYKNPAVKNFVLNLMQRFKIKEANRFKALKRISGKAARVDWNFKSPLSSYCLAIDRNGPKVVKCSAKMGYLCQKGYENFKEQAFWTKWYSSSKPKRGVENEDLKVIVKKLNSKYKNRADRLCRFPLEVQCREVGTNKVYSQSNTYGFKLASACVNNRIKCIDRQQRIKRKCPDFEMRFLCRQDNLDCKTSMMKNYCKKLGKVCVDRRTGPACVKWRQKPSGAMGLSSCMANGKQYVLHKCKASGDPHYLTLDGLKFDFMGTCSYDFVSTCNGYVPTESFPSFRMSVKNYKKNKRGYPSWTKSFELSIGDNTYRFTQGKFFMNDLRINAVGFSNDQLKINAQAKGRGTKLIIVTSFCLKILWDNKHGLYIYVPEVYKKYTCGLCGNFDGNKHNDLAHPKTKKWMNPSMIGRYFLVKGSDDSQCPFKVDQPKPCSKANVRKFSRPQYCGVLNGVIAQWVKKNSAGSSWPKNKKALKEEFEECINDLCWDATTDRCHDLEDVIEELAEEFGGVDSVTDTKWRKQSGCEPKCGGDMVYSKNKRPFCQNSCVDPDKSQNCNNENEQPGCVCKKGYVLNSKLKCVPLAKCEVSCTVRSEDGDSFSLSSGDEFVVTPCELIKVCQNGKLIEKKMKPCSLHADCTGEGKKCVCHDGYVGDGVICKTDLSCRKGWTAVGEKCYKYIPKVQDWNSAAITCGAIGGSLARYDDDIGEELVTFFGKISSLNNKSKAKSRKIFCRPGAKCQLPRRFIGLSVKLLRKRDKKKCGGKYSLSANKKFVKVQGNCKAMFVVKMIKESKNTVLFSKRLWVGGNSLILKQGQRGDKAPFQCDPPKMLDLTVFPNPNGCFQATINKKRKLIVTPNPNCNLKRPSICEYDNIGKKPYNPIDFIRLKVQTNYRDAVQKCKKMKRPLVTIDNKVQLNQVRKLLKNMKSDGWIGAQYSKGKNKFIWSNNKPLVYTNWRRSEPNNYNRNKASNEQCVAMSRKRGWWNTADCSVKNYPVCGLPLDMEVAIYSKYYPVKGISSLAELKEKLARLGQPAYVCKDPISIECSAKDTNTGSWINNYNKKGKSLVCNKNKLKCRKKRGLDCRTFRVRFMCPPVVDQCAALRKEKIQPCSGGRICIPVKNHFTCRCPKGTTFNKKTQKCVGYCGKCKAAGDPHYVTYAGKKYDFMGVCMYKFTGTCDLPEFKNRPNFDVYSKNKRCGNRGASCIHYVEVHLRNIPYRKKGKLVTGNFFFTVERGTKKYTMNDKSMNVGQLEIDGAVKIVRKRDYFFLFSPALSLKVMYSGTHLSVLTPSTFRHKMCGLCGDCGSNKFRMKDNSLVKIPSYRRKAMIKYANEWIVPFDGSDPKRCKVLEPFEECKPDVKAKISKPNMCGVFKDKKSSISECFSAVDPNPFYENCMVDACHDKAVESVCRTVKVYVQACMDKDIVLAWRTPDFCPMDCKEKIYRADASCEPMCGRDTSVGVCEEEPEEGCVCPDGYMKQGDDCVRPQDCGCEIVTEEGETMLLPPGKSMLLPRCEERAICEVQEDGSMEELRETVPMEPNTVCVENPQPTIACADGYIMQSDGKTCKKEPKACAEGFVDKSGMCIKTPSVLLIWRQAAQACNEKDGTLVRIDTKLKLEAIAEIMKKKNYDQVFISGQVIAKKDSSGNFIFKPVLSEKDRGKVQFANYDYQDPPLLDIRLAENLSRQTLQENTVLSLVIRREEGSKVSIIAVARDTKANFVCEERKDKPEEEVWYGPCNSDSLMDDDGDQETKESLKNVEKCNVCPYPKNIKCTKVKGDSGSVEGECKLRKNGKYYTCDQGGDCIDKEVSTKCAKDIDECAKDLDDCPPKSSCVNTIGGYFCKCDADVPLMLDGICKPKSTCEMYGPKKIEDFEYKVTGLSKIPGYFGYKCPFNIFSTCKADLMTDSQLPIITLYTVPYRTSGKLVSVISGEIQDPDTKNKRTFMIDRSFLEKGMIMYGPAFNKVKKTLLGFGCRVTKTSFTFVPPNTFVMQHFDKHFRIMITYPFTVKIEVTPELASLACGVCRLKPPEPEMMIKVTPSQERELSGDKAGGCFVDLTEEKETTTTTTTPPTTTTPQTTTTTTTPQTTTTTTTTPPPTTTTTPPPTTTTTTTPPPTTTTTTTPPPTTTTTTTPPPTTTTTTTPPPTTTTTTTPPPTTTTTTTPPPTTTTTTTPPPTTTTTTTPPPTTTTTTTPPPTTTTTTTPQTTTTTTPPPTTTTTTTPPPPTTTMPPTTTTTPPTTTTTPPAPAPTTQPPVPTPTTTTQPPTPSSTPATGPPPTTAPCRDEVNDFCSGLNDLCEDFNKDLCVKKICEMNMEFCDYLKNEDFKCQDGAKMASFLKDVDCDKVCPNEMTFQHTNGAPQERCQEVEDSNRENPELARAFGCVCDCGYKLSGEECIPEEECGCTDMMEGLYMKPGDVTIDTDCTVKKICVERNKFREEAIQCGDNAECKYKENGYQCQCMAGFNGDAEKKDGCKKGEEDETKICYNVTNVDGVNMKSCECKSGYVSNCQDCVDLDECKENRHDCDLSVEKCVNTPGSYKCSCGDGFDEKDGKCVDINECKMRIARCGPHEGCINLPGSYDCKCCAGFVFNKEIKECVKDPKGVEILVTQPKCCLICDDEKLCQESEFNPIPYCAKNGPANFKEFKSYKELFQYQCVNNIFIAKSAITKGLCPQVLEPPISPPGGPGGNGGNQPGPNGQTNPNGPTSTRGPLSCEDPNFCKLIPQPPTKLAKGKVCGPPNQRVKKTYNSYCAMVKDICKKLGGPGYLPKVPIPTQAGKCKKTPTGPVVEPPQITKPPEPTDVAPTATRPGPTPTLPPSEPLFLEWSPWTVCRISNAASKCGVGLQRRRRDTMSYEDGREVLPVDRGDIFEERACFKPCVPIDPNYKCPETSVCDGQESPVCGSIGRGGTDTYNSECELNVLACQAGEKPVFVSDGECNDDKGSEKKLCKEAGPLEILKKYNKEYKGQQCVGEEKTIKVCKGLVCEGGSGNCCIPSGYEKIKAGITCYNDNGDVTMKGSVVYISVTSCRCSKGENDEPGTEDVKS